MSLPIICVMGPTASGKTALAMELVQKFPCEIISVDSGMVYKGMDIGTAKPTTEQLKAAPHRLIDILDPKEIYSAAQFRLDALTEIKDILQVDHIPLLVGGTMLYFKVLQHGISQLPSADLKVRGKIIAEAMQCGWETMHAKLQKIDSKAAARIKANDAQRIQRALEIYEITGKTMSEWFMLNPPQALPYRIINIAIAPQDRAELDTKIWQRLQLMLQQGFVAEVDALRKRCDLSLDLPSMRSVGYRQVWQYLQGDFDYEEMQQKIAIATRQLAKRQMTWLCAWPDVKWLDSKARQVSKKVIEYLKSTI